MRIGIDAHPLGTGIGGNETYFRGLLFGLREIAPELDVITYVNRELLGQPGAAAGFPMHALRSRSAYLRVPFALPHALLQTRADLLHTQYQAPPICPCPFVLTVHDIVWARYPHTLRAVDRRRLQALVPGSVRRAARVFVVSEAMKREISAYYNAPIEKFDVTPNAVDPIFQPILDEGRLDAVRTKYGLNRDFILYIGALQPRKNLVRLARAVKLLRGRGFPHQLVLTGRRLWLFEELEREIDALGLGDGIVFTGYADRPDLPALLSATSAFAYVSEYEGMGVPVAEALACGAPTLISRDPALNEVAAGNALVCDETDAENIASHLERLLTDSGLRSQLRAGGPQRAAHFTRANMARAALEGYRKALEGS